MQAALVEAARFMDKVCEWHTPPNFSSVLRKHLTRAP
jgi:hypothetical protein